jgi:hypothetical protein
MRVLARNPAPAQLRRVEVDKGDVEAALAGGKIAPAGADAPDAATSGAPRSNPTKNAPTNSASEAASEDSPEGLSERIFGQGSSASQNPEGAAEGTVQSDLSNSKEASPTPVGDASRGTSGTGASNQPPMAEETRENPQQGVIQKQFGNAAQVFLPAVAVEAGNRASTLITGGVANTSAVQGQGAFVQRTVAIGAPIVLGILTFMVGSRMDNVYVKQSAVGMAIPAADAVLDPLLSPVESSLSNGGSEGSNGQEGIGYGEYLVEENGMGLPAAEPREAQAQEGLGIERSVDLTSEGPDDRFAQVAVN